MVRLRNGRCLTATSKRESPPKSSSKTKKKRKKIESPIPSIHSTIPKVKPESQTLMTKPSSRKKGNSPPQHWQEVHDLIQKMRMNRTADVDTMGCETFTETALPPHENRFRTLISAMLSSQTKDTVNAAAMDRLKKHGLTVENVLKTSQQDLEKLIYPVSFFKNKSKYIKAVCEQLKQDAEGKEFIDIPDTFQGLKSLPGVGPKMAHLVMTCAWERTEGICVDIHVHRISNRLGWVKTWNKASGNSRQQDPEKTREELEQWLPREHWATINPLLVGFGQTICTPLRPKCESCTVNQLCPSAFKAKI